MKSAGFKRPPPRPARQWTADELPGARVPVVVPVVDAQIAPAAKENALQHEGYMNLVRAMPCAHCGRPPRSEFCHADAGKGKGIKTDCRRGWPGCKDDLSANREGCHTLIGSRGVFAKERRRALEDRYAAQTRAAIIAAGTWPARLPKWSEHT